MLLSRVADAAVLGRPLPRAGRGHGAHRARVHRGDRRPADVGRPRRGSRCWRSAGSRERVRRVATPAPARPTSCASSSPTRRTRAASSAAIATQPGEPAHASARCYPREAWQVGQRPVPLRPEPTARRRSTGAAATAFLSRVIAESQRIDGILTSTMSRDEAYEMLRLGQAIERADMTTRVLGVRAAALLDCAARGRRPRRGAVDGRAALASARADVPARHRGPIDGDSVVRFLLTDRASRARCAPAWRASAVALDRAAARASRSWSPSTSSMPRSVPIGWTVTTRSRSTRRWTALQLRLAALSAAINDEFFAGRS